MRKMGEIKKWLQSMVEINITLKIILKEIEINVNIETVLPAYPAVEKKLPVIFLK